jgi:hypothetical protein
VRAHVLLCMLAYYLQWHMRQSLAPMLSDEPDPVVRDAQRTSPVAKAEPSPAAQRKAARKRTDPAGVPKRQSPPDFPLSLFNLTIPCGLRAMLSLVRPCPFRWLRGPA